MHTGGSGPARVSGLTAWARGLLLRGEAVALAGSAHEQALSTQEVAIVADGDGDGWTVLVPVTERGDVMGLLDVSLASKPKPDTIEYLVAAGHAPAYVLIAVRRHTDLFEWAQRDAPFSVSAEIQRRLLPSAYTAEAGPVTLAGWLEPSHTAGGDTFDYFLDREYLYLSLTDAMGHSTQAALSPPWPSARCATGVGRRPPQPSRPTRPTPRCEPTPAPSSSSPA